MNNHNKLILTATAAIALFGASCAKAPEPVEAAAPAPQTQAPAAQSQAPVTPAPIAPARRPDAPSTRYDRPAPSERPAAAPARARTATIAAGTMVPVRIEESLSSEKNQAGDTWTGTLSEPLVVNGFVVAERGSSVSGRVNSVKRAGRVKGDASLSVSLTSMEIAGGQRVNVQTGTYTAVGKDTTKRDMAKVGIASGVGAAIGAIVGKGKGAAIGAGSGAAAGTGVVLATRGGAAQIASEALVRFRITDPVVVTEPIR